MSIQHTHTHGPRVDWRLARSAALFAVALALLATVAAGSAMRAPVASAAPGPGSLALADASQTATPAVAAAPVKVTAPKKGCYVGIYRPPAPFDPASIDKYKSVSGKAAAMVMWYQPWANGPNRLDKAMLVSVWKRGAVPIISWEPWSFSTVDPSNQPAFQLKNIINGNFDPYITQFALDCKDAGGPIMISLMHEMNGRWYPWGGVVNGNTPADSVAAWQHIHDVFTANGVTNVTWVWSINLRSRPLNNNNRYSLYYPGNSYVDWVGVSGFNWGQGVGGGPWMSFEQLLADPLKYLKTTHKPVIITETASVENGGNKSKWITTTFTRIRKNHPEIKAVLWFDARVFSHTHWQDWRINSSKKSLASYRSVVKSSYFNLGQPAPLTNWRKGLTPDEWSTLLATKWIY